MNGASTTFDSSKSGLSELLKDIHQGKIQLPDFQRGWVWDDDHVRSLLASVSLAFPIGTLMLLQTGSEKVRFRPRLVEGVIPKDGIPYPDKLILDGQQRLTSLFQSLYSGAPVETRNARKKPIQRWYYIDIRAALSANGDREEAIISVPEDKKLRNFRGEVIANYSTTELECAASMFPLPLVFDTAGLTQWQMAYLKVLPEQLPERLERWNRLVSEVVQRFQQYQVPVITLLKETPKEAVCQVFEKVNTGGVTLTVFELLTASFAADDFNLRDDWAERVARLKKRDVLTGLQSTDFLQVLTLLVTYAKREEAIQDGVSEDNAPGISCKRKEILRLEVDEYRAWAANVEEGFERAARFLHRQKIFTSRDVPYRTQIIPLAAIMAILNADADKDGILRKIEYWYWCGVLGELYGSAVETRFARDLPEVVNWVYEQAGTPRTLDDANFVRDRLYTLRTRNSAAYKGIHALLMRDGCQDFLTGQRIDTQLYFDDQMDIHHIFPRDWCDRQGIDIGVRDCIINKTPISAKTNRKIGGRAPSIYLQTVERDGGIQPERMDEILTSHLVDPDALRHDDFGTFFAAREETLLRRIEDAMGKAAVRGSVSPEFIIEDDYEGAEESEDATE